VKASPERPHLRLISPDAEEKRQGARERARRYRARRKSGHVLLTVEVSGELILWLADHGWIGEKDKLNRATLETEISNVLDCLANKKLIANLDEVTCERDA
jgi:hypothetical protein